jgi:hypothetical protein
MRAWLSLQLIVGCLFPFRLLTQNDTILQKNGVITPCRITQVNNHKIFYIDKQEIGRFTELKQVDWYSQNGARQKPPVESYKPQSMRRIDSVNVSDELAFMRTCLTKFHAQYNTGISLILVGGAITGSSYFISTDDNLQKYLGIGGIAMMLVGGVFVIDAHKWFNRAGWGVSGKGNMVEVRYRFK